MRSPRFNHQFTVRLADTDAAGVVYFNRLLERAHEAYEAWLESAGIGLTTWMEAGVQLPLVHAEADFLAPLTLGRRVRTLLLPGPPGRTSFTLDYRFLGDGDALLARARTVHVAMQNGESIPLPERLGRMFEQE